jgi:hypothetical protein
MTSLDIVSLIESNPLTRFHPTYQSKLVTKIKDQFSDTQQQLFLSSFYCYLNCGPDEYVIDLDNVWKWCGFSRKDKGKALLVKRFKENEHYIIKVRENCNLPQLVEDVSRPGPPKERVLMTVNTFKKFCMKAQTSKADELHDYYIKLESILQETLEEQSEELTNQLQIKDNQLQLQIEESEIDKQLIAEHNEKESQLEKERVLIEQNPLNTMCVYYGYITETSTKGEKLIKFGRTNDIKSRLRQHKALYLNFKLENVYSVSNHVKVENIIKQHPVMKPRIRSIIINGNNYTEHLAICDDQTVEEFKVAESKRTYKIKGTNRTRPGRTTVPTPFDIDVEIRKIIEEHEYNLNKYTLLLEENEQLKLNAMKSAIHIKNLESTIKKCEKKIGTFNMAKLTKTNSTTVCKGTHVLYAFRETKDTSEDNSTEGRYICGIYKNTDVYILEKCLLEKFPDGVMEYTVKISEEFAVKRMEYLMKKKLVLVDKSTFKGFNGAVKNVMDICTTLEDVLTKNDTNTILTNLSNFQDLTLPSDVDSLVPTSSRAPRSVDKIHPITGQVVGTFATFAAAGKSVGVTGAAISNAVRNPATLTGKGEKFKWRYTSISNNDQMTPQKVVKVNCSTGERVHFPNIASAARDVNISSPGLRTRILTKYHTNGFHWIFDEGASHYTS